MLNMLKKAKEAAIRATKETAIAVAAEPLVKVIGNKYLKGIGEIESFKLDTANKKIEATVQLEGEVGCHSVVIDEYSITSTEAGTTFNIVRCSSPDRPWLNTIAERHIAGLELPIPDKFAKVAEELAR